jgi:AcrR family transcriptional regulator
VPTAGRRQRPSGYHSPLRARQAVETRRAILNAATNLFAERGWAGTTLSAVAAEAGTAIETVYSAFRSKSGLLIAAIDAAIVGDEDETPLVDRPEFVGLGTGALSERLTAAARIITLALVRAVPLMGALAEASANDAAARARLNTYESDRRAVIAVGLELVLGKPAPESLIDSIWAIAGPEVFAKLTKERHWSIETYQSWLVEIGLALFGVPTSEDAPLHGEEATRG